MNAVARPMCRWSLAKTSPTDTTPFVCSMLALSVPRYVLASLSTPHSKGRTHYGDNDASFMENQAHTP